MSSLYRFLYRSQTNLHKSSCRNTWVSVTTHWPEKTECSTFTDNCLTHKSIVCLNSSIMCFYTSRPRCRQVSSELWGTWTEAVLGWKQTNLQSCKEAVWSWNLDRTHARTTKTAVILREKRKIFGAKIRFSLSSTMLPNMARLSSEVS